MKKIVWLLGLFLVVCFLFFFLLPVNYSSPGGYRVIEYHDPLALNPDKVIIQLDHMYGDHKDST